jgi:Immunity protein 26
VTEVPTNLRVLQRSRKAPLPGDVFTMQLPDQQFVFGRVVSTQARWTAAMGADPAILIYIYRGHSVAADIPDRVAMSVKRLLVPPIMTNRRPWSSGYFQRLGNLPLESGDVLSQHCFLSASRGRYFDEQGNELPGPVEPVGDHGLHSFRTIDDQVSDALGIPRVPED